MQLSDVTVQAEEVSQRPLLSRDRNYFKRIFG